MCGRIFGILFVGLMSMLLSCSDEPDYDYGDFLEVVAVYQGSTAEGCMFAYQARDDSPVVTLRVSGSELKDVDAGERIMLRYTVLDDLSATEKLIRIDAASKIVNDVLRQADEETLGKISSEPVDMTSVWRSGRYVNVFCWVPYVGSHFQMLLVAEESALDDEVPELRLLYDMMGGIPAFERRCYASFDIGNLWERETCRGVRIRVDDVDGEKIYEFNKKI